MECINLKTIELYNYRQFNEAKVDFSLDKSKPFTIIEGKNGFGKSNLLNALTWCFYGVEEHLKHAEDEEVEPIINTREIANLKNGERLSARVIIRLSSSDGDIRIEREIWGKKFSEKFLIEEQSVFQVLRQDRGNWIQVHNPTYIINKILPQIVIRFFFFDGEQLRQFFENISQEDVKNAIFDISQISLIELAISNLDKVLSDYRAEDRSDNPRLKELKDNIEFYKRNIEDMPNKIKELEIDNQEGRKRISTIESELRSSSIEVIKNLQEERDRFQNEQISRSDELDEAEVEFGDYLMKVSPLILSKDAILNSLEILSKLSMEGILPPKIEDTFVRELLDIKKECICGTDLSAGKAREKLITMLKERKLKEGVSKDANELKYELNHLLREIENFDEKSKKLSLKIIGSKDKLKEVSEKLSEIEAKLKKYGGIGKEDILKKEEERNKFLDAIDKNNQNIAALKLKVDDFRRKLKEAEDEYDSISKEVDKNKKIIAKREFIKNGKKVLTYIQDKLINELRKEIEKNTKDFFTNMVSYKAFKDITIDEDYKIKVLKESSYNTLKSLSVGETLMLGLSFMAALRKVSGFEAPVVIDTPLATTDTEYRDNLIDFMVTALTDTQIILLVKDTEYTDNVKSKLDVKTGAKKLLQHDKVTGFTEVVNLG